MKNLLFLICIITLCWSCSSNNEEPEIPQIEPKEYIVSLGLTGEIDIEESPLSKSSGNDLYGIQVYSKTSTSEYTPYAYGLFDDKSLMTIKVLEGYKYRISATMVVDGKNKISSNYGYRYSHPFYIDKNSNTLINSFNYSNSVQFAQLYRGMSSLAGTDYDVFNNTFDVPNTERFYGEIENYIPSESKNISINMKRVCFGVKFIADGLTEGKLKISIKKAPEIIIQYNDTEIQEIFTFENKTSSRTGWIEDNYSETIPVSISWEKADGAIIPLINKDIIFKRNVLTTITIKVKDTSINNGIDITHESGEMTKCENITIESGTGLDGNIDPIKN